MLLRGDTCAFSESFKRNISFLDTKEQEWIENLKTPIRIGITQIPNQILKNKKYYRGYSIDLFNILENILGIKFKYVYYNTWNELLLAAKNRDIDVVFFAQKTQERLKYLDFTDIILVQHNKIIASSKKYLQLNITDLFGKKVCVVKDSAIEKFIEKNYPEITLLKTRNELESLEKLLKKDVDYTVLEPVRASYYMETNNIANFYITGEFPYNYKLRIATRNDIPILNIILNKGVEHISPAQKKALALKWGYEKYTLLDKKLIIYITIIFTIVLVFVFYLSFLNKKLKKAQKSLAEVNTILEKRIEEEVKKNRQKDILMLNQSRFAQMGQAINMIAHQWKQPLNNLSIMIQAHYIKSKQFKVSDSDIDNFKNKSMLQIKQMTQTIDDFRNFFKQQKEKSRFSFDDVIKHLIYVVEPILEKSNIEQKVVLQENISLNGYSNELVQAIINIIYNAKDALVQNRQHGRKIDIFLKKDTDRALLYIKDNGGGIPENIIENIFNPYFSTKGDDGTGIGLYMAKIIIEEHMEGKIYAYNEDEGAVFYIELPTIPS